MNDPSAPDHETLLSLCDDYIERYNLTDEEALGEPPKVETAANPEADELAKSVREYFLEMDRSNFFVHFGKAKDRLNEMHEALTSYYAGKVDPPSCPR